MFDDLFAYDHWANRQWLDRLRAIDDDLPRAHRLLAHLLVSKRVWLGRLDGTSADTTGVDLWPEMTLDDCAALVEKVHTAYTAYLADLSEADLERAAAYRNTSGKAFQTPVREILMHVVTHAHYHRGQIAQTVRQQGHEPVWTDYIAYVRTRS